LPIITHNPEINKEFSDFVSRLMAKKREDRPKDFHDVLMKMRQIPIYKPAPKESKGERGT
jgi:hypothetical protein